jgi:riboflavin kinase / FMN adenylyltransferase
MEVPRRFCGVIMTVGCIGVFDGVHLGHRALISQARELGQPVLAVTFDPHPRSVVGSGAPTSLATVEHRCELLTQAGASEVAVLAFTPELAQMTPESFVTDVLVDHFGLSNVVVGENFRFGAKARGDVSLMAHIGQSHGLEVHAVPLVTDALGRWSSSRIRELLAAGDIARANEGLARNYRLTGPVVYGAARGRELGYPTANVEPVGDPTFPADGVYGGYLNAGEGRWPAAISIGMNPQFDGKTRTVEAYVVDRSGLDLYGDRVDIEFLDRIRGQQRFDSVSDLQGRMARDVEWVRRHC